MRGRYLFSAMIGLLMFAAGLNNLYPVGPDVTDVFAWASLMVLGLMVFAVSALGFFRVRFYTGLG